MNGLFDECEYLELCGFLLLVDDHFFKTSRRHSIVFEFC
jgi:hypothetical protein